VIHVSVSLKRIRVQKGVFECATQPWEAIQKAYGSKHGGSDGC